MGLLSKAQILAADKKKTKEVPVREWGGSVMLQELSAAERDLWEAESFITEPGEDGEAVARFNPKQARARLVVRCLVDDKGKRLFQDDEVASVGSLSASSVQKLFEAARALNAISASDIEELEGNSGAAPSGGSSSSSASASA